MLVEPVEFEICDHCSVGIQFILGHDETRWCHNCIRQADGLLPDHLKAELRGSKKVEGPWIHAWAIEGARNGFEWLFCSNCKERQLLQLSDNDRPCSMNPMCEGKMQTTVPVVKRVSKRMSALLDPESQAVSMFATPDEQPSKSEADDPQS